MRKTLFLYLIAFLAFSTIAAENFKTIKGDGNIVTKEIPISEYTQLKIGGNIEKSVFNYSQKESHPSVQLTIDSNLLPYLKIQVENGCLIINTRNNERLLPTRLIINSQSVELNKAQIDGTYRFIFQTGLNAKSLELTAGGATDVRSKQAIEVEENCKIQVSGVGKLNVDDLHCSDLSAEVKDCGELFLKGEAKSGEYKVVDAGKINAYEFVMEELDCHIDDSGEAKAHVTERLKGEISAAGVLQYKGFPRSDVQCKEIGKAKRIK